MSRILVLTVEGTGESRRLAAGALTVGRADGNDWVLADQAVNPTLSRQHCRFDAGPNGASVADLRSSNGTKVDGQVVVPRIPTPLRGGEAIELGPYRLLVELMDGEAHALDLPLLPTHDAHRSMGLPPIMDAESSAARPSDAIAARDRRARQGATDQPANMRGRLDKDPLGDYSKDLPTLPGLRRHARVQDETERSDRHRPQWEAALRPDPPSSRADAPVELASELRKASLSLFEDNTEVSQLPHESSTTSPMETLDGHVSDPALDPFGLGTMALRSGGPSPPVAATSDDRTAAQARAVVEATRSPATAGTTEEAPPMPTDTVAAAPLAAFLKAAGVPASAAEGQTPEAFLGDAGQVFASLADGLRDLLAVRATVKDHARLDRTQISAASNNPLKLSVNRREATAALLGRGEEGYMPPLAAVQASFRDLKAHELALFEGLQSAVDELLKLFDPAQLERKLADAGTLALLLQGGRRAQLWELYQERYDEIVVAARARFMGHMDAAFREAYARKSRELSAPAGSPP